MYAKNKLYFSSLFKLMVGVSLVVTGCSHSNPSRPFSGSETTDKRNEVEIVTWNAGLLRVSPTPYKSLGIDLVSCVRNRIPVIVDEIIRAFQDKTPRAILLQEFWNEEAFDKLIDKTKNSSLKVIPSTYSEVTGRGTVIVTNLEVQTYDFMPFSQDSSGVNRGILSAHLLTPQNNEALVVGSLHTTYSTAKTVGSLQLTQLGEIVQWMKSYNNVPAVLGGDFNAGPNLVYDNQEWEPSKVLWEPLQGSSWKPVMDRKGNYLITWDRGRNPLTAKPALAVRAAYLYNGGNWEEQTSTLDHIFVNPRVESSSGKLAFHGLYSIEGCPTLPETDGKTTLSDHYGIQTTVRF